MDLVGLVLSELERDAQQSTMGWFNSWFSSDTTPKRGTTAPFLTGGAARALTAARKQVLDTNKYYARDDWAKQPITMIHRAAAKGRGVIFSKARGQCCVCGEETA